MRPPAWLESASQVDAGLPAADINGQPVPIRVGYLYIEGRPVVASDNPEALRKLALHAEQLAERLDAQHAAAAR